METLSYNTQRHSYESGVRKRGLGGHHHCSLLSTPTKKWMDTELSGPPQLPLVIKNQKKTKRRRRKKKTHQTKQKETTLYPQPFLPAENSQKHQEEVFLFNSLFKISLQGHLHVGNGFSSRTQAMQIFVYCFKTLQPMQDKKGAPDVGSKEN